MKTKGILGGLVVSAALLWAVIAGARFCFGMILHALTALELDPQTGLLLGCAAILVLWGALVIRVAIRSRTHQELEIRRAEALVPIYTQIMKAVAEQLPPPEHAQRVLFLQGGATVLKEFRALLALRSHADTVMERVNRQTSRLLLAMRRDLGATTLGLEQEDWSSWLRCSPDRAGEKDEVPTAVERNGSLSLAPVHRP